jgi:hypothetical protein
VEVAHRAIKTPVIFLARNESMNCSGVVPGSCNHIGFKI